MHLEDQTETTESLYLWRGQDGTTVITRDRFISLTSRGHRFAILCRESESGILPFLLAEAGSTEEDIFGLEDEEGFFHVDPRLPVPCHFGLSGDDSYLEVSPCDPNVVPLLRRFHWCVFTPFDEDPKGEQYELRFATARREDAEFVSEALGCCDPLIVPVADEDIEVV